MPEIQGYEPKLTDGVISSTSGVKDDATRFQISNPLQKGNSGGPLFLEDGRLVGVIVARLRDLQDVTFQNVNYAIKSSVLLDFLPNQGLSLNIGAPQKSSKRAEVVASVERSLGFVQVYIANPAERVAEEGPPTPQPAATAKTSFPERPITLVLPYAAGSPIDRAARLVAEGVGRAIGTSVNVVNQLGDSGLLATTMVAQASPDGYTVLFQNTGVVWAPLANGSDPRQLLEALQPIGKVYETPMILAANSRLGLVDLQSTQRLVETGKRLTITHAGRGTPSHACALITNAGLLKNSGEVREYRGFAPALIETTKGNADLICSDLPSIEATLVRKHLAAVAVVTPDRSGRLYEIRTAFEQGGDTMFSLWAGFFAPRTTPAPIIQKIAAAIQVSLRDKDVRRSLATLGVIPVDPDQAAPEYFSALIQHDIGRYTKFFQR